MNPEETTQLETVPATDLLVVGTDAITNAANIATKLSKLIDTQHLYHDLDGHKYVVVDGWTTLGALLGVFPRVLGTVRRERPVTRVLVGKQLPSKYKKGETYEKKAYVDPAMVDETMKLYQNPLAKDGALERQLQEVAYTAQVQLVNLASGKVIAEAEAVCSNLEEGKLTNPEYSLSSMAQTRATGKAFRLAFSWIMRLAGYDATPWEEMQDFVKTDAPPADPKRAELDKIKAAVKTPAAKAMTLGKMSADPRWTPEDLKEIEAIIIN